MTRATIRLDEREYALAKKHASKLGISLAEWMRRTIRDVLPVEKGKPWMRYAGFVESGNPRFSRSVDETVYGRQD
jgi:hypothetical protein